MLESRVRPALETLLSPLAKMLTKFAHATPFIITVVALAFGVAVLPLMLLNFSKLATILLWASYLSFLMSSSLTLANKPINKLNALYDAIASRVVEFAIIFGFYLLSPGIIAWISILLLASSWIATTVHLTICILSGASEQSLYQSNGLLDRLEVFIIFSILIAFPITYGVLGVALAILLLCTAAFRILEFQRAL